MKDRRLFFLIRSTTIIFKQNLVVGTLLLSLLYPILATAKTGSIPLLLQSLLTQAEQQKLSQHPYWLALLHYPKQKKFSTQTSSQIKSKEFFLSPQGNHKPKLELAATLRAFFTPVEEKITDPRCRFIARYHWLKKQLTWPEEKEISCAKFDDFNQQGNINSISLIFATGYLSNPASFYGHVLLKLNNQHNSKYQVELLDQSINYGAIVPKNENSLIYVLKGLFGGYDAAFSHDVFYRQNHIYIENELRDLWEYQLNLNQDQVNQLIHHAWELMGAKFQYYFLNKNCAYAMADLLELVVDAPLKSNSPIWALPIDLFNNLTNNTTKNSSLVSEIRYLPSRQNQFYHHFHQLHAQQKTELQNIVNDPYFSLSNLSKLSESSQIKIINALLDYYAFRQLDDNDRKMAKERKQRLLIHRIQLQSDTPENSKTSTAQPPTSGPLPLMLRVGIQQQKQQAANLLLTTRLSYYDLLNLEAGRLPHTQLTTLELQLILQEEQIRFKQLDFFKIQNLNVSQSGLEKEGGVAWKVHFFADKDHNEQPNNISFNLQLGIGKALQLTRHTLIYAMSDAILSDRPQERLQIRPYAALLTSLTPFWKSHLILGQTYSLNEQKTPINQWQWQNRFGNSRHWDLRLNYQQQQSETSLSTALSLYW